MIRSQISLILCLIALPCAAEVLYADANGDGIVDASDVILLQREWKLVGDPVSGGSLWMTDGSNIYRLTGNVGIGTASPQALLDVAGMARFDEVRLHGDSRNPVILSDSSGAGSITVNGPDSVNLSLTSVNTPADDSIDKNRGRILVRAENNASRGEFLVGTGGEGELRLRGPSGNLNAVLGGIEENPDYSMLELYDLAGVLKTSVRAENAGHITTFNSNGDKNVEIKSGSGIPSTGGAVDVYTTAGSLGASMYVFGGQGFVQADVGDFGSLAKHRNYPLKQNVKLLYSGVTSRRPSITHSGVVHLEQGRATLVLPEDFVVLAEPGTLVVNLTPGALESKGVAAQVGEDSSIQIGELAGGTGSYDVFYSVTAEESGNKDYKTILTQVEYEKQFGAHDDSSAGNLSAKGKN